VAAGATADAVNFGSSTDWQNQIFKTTATVNHAISFGGGNDKSQYRTSGEVTWIRQE